MNVNGSFGQWLGQCRKALDLTQVDLADQVGCSVMTVRKIERDVRRPSKQIAERLATVLAIAPEQRAAFVAFARKSPTTPLAPSVPGQRSSCLNLPRQTTQFVGRSSELAHIAECLADSACQLLTLVGPGGIGKTRLALQAASQHSGDFTDGVCFVPLASVSSPDLVAAAIAGALKIALNGREEPNVQIINYLHEKHMLLVMDNFEHLLDAVGLPLDLLAAGPKLQILVTSRERLNLQEEWVFALEGLSFPKGVAMDYIEPYSAVQLFVQRARQVQTGFSLAENADAVIRICQAVEGMPLALELAATWLRVMPCRQIAGQIQRDMDFLASPLHNVAERHRSLRAVFDHSWSLLTEAECSVLSKLSVFRGDFDLEAAKHVAGASLVVLAGLADKSLIRLHESGRYDLHELLRQYTLDRLDEDGQLESTARRHLEYFLGLAEQAETQMFGPHQPGWLERLETDLDNLQAALAWSMRGDAAEVGLRLAAALGWFWFFRAYFRQGLQWLEKMLTSSSGASASLRAKALHRAGDLALVLHEYKRSVALCEEGLALAHQVEDRPAIAWSMCSLGIALGNLDDFDRAVLFLEEALALFREMQDGWGMHHALVRLGMVETTRGHYERATTVLEESLALSRQVEAKIAVARSLEHLADVYLAWDTDPARAKVLYEKSLLRHEETHDIIRLAIVLWKLANIVRFQGNYEKARTLAKRGLTEMQRVNAAENRRYAFSLAQIGGLDGAAGHPERAARLLAASGAPFQSIGASTARDRAQFESDVAAARVQLGEDAFTAAWAEGKAMTRDQAIAYALSEVL